jgi:hypothetical protein
MVAMLLLLVTAVMGDGEMLGNGDNDDTTAVVRCLLGNTRESEGDTTERQRERRSGENESTVGDGGSSVAIMRVQ